jgi:photosystem II stability/assembly factor-like uncharacterized protein
MAHFRVYCVLASITALLLLSAFSAPVPHSRQPEAEAGTTFRHSRAFNADASEIWTSQTSGTAQTLWSVRALSSKEAWIAGDSGVVLRTIDAGATWRYVGGASIGVEPAYNIEAIDSSTAFVTTSTATVTHIFRTTDGGTRWDTVYSLANGFVDAIHMFDSDNGIAVGDPVSGTWVVLRSSDGGATWRRTVTEPLQSKGETGSPNSLAAAGDSLLVFGTSVGTIYRSTDRGATWTGVSTSQQLTTAVALLESGIGIFTGADSRTLPPAFANSRTTDGGATWQTKLGPFGASVNPVAGAGSSDFWAASSNSIYRSTDAGVTWHIDVQIPGYAFLALAVLSSPDGASGWAVGGGGTIYRLQGATLTGVRMPQASAPRSVSLDQNYPNPFNPTTTIRYGLPNRTHVNLAVFNTLGQQVASLVNEYQEAGIHNFKFEAEGLASGVYFYRIQAGDFVAAKKLLLIR